MSAEIKEGRWVRIASEVEHQRLKSHGTLKTDSDWTADVQKGKYAGPGLYMLFNYSQRCPRGCCYDSVYEVMPADEVAEMAKSDMIELAEILQTARKG